MVYRLLWKIISPIHTIARLLLVILKTITIYFGIAMYIFCWMFGEADRWTWVVAHYLVIGFSAKLLIYILDAGARRFEAVGS